MLLDSDDDDDGPMASAKGRALKRAREDPQHSVIMQTLQQEQAEKQARKQDKVAVKGKTLKEIEEEEGGPVKESLVGIAQVKRAAGRKKKDEEDDTDIPADVGAYEEEAEVEEEDGVKLMPFNLNEEREIGSFDEEGNFVESRVAKEDRDAWLESTEVVNDKVREMLEQRRKAEEAAEAAEARRQAAPMTDRQLAQLKQEVGQHMLPGETVARALKRIRAEGGGGDGAPGGSKKVLGKREKLRLQQQGAVAAAGAPGGKGGSAAAGGGQGGPAAATEPAAGTSSGGGGGGDAGLQLFMRLAEVVDQLFAEGETDVYSATKEEFDKAVAMWLPKTAPPPAAAAPAAGAAAAGAGAATKAAAGGKDEDGDDDMFGDEFEGQTTAAAAEAEPVTSSVAPAAAATAVAAPQPPPPSASSSAAHAPAPAPAPRTDFSSWPVRELSRFLAENGVSMSGQGAVEKADLVAKAAEVEGKQLEAATAAAATAATAGVPAGYEYDSASGYYRSAETGLYFDTASGAYYDGTTWLRYDADTGQYMPA